MFLKQTFCLLINRLENNVSKRQEEYFWVIGGGILQVPLIDEVRKLDYKVIVSDASDSCVCRDKTDIFLKIDIFNSEEHIRSAAELVKQGILIKGVLAAGIDATITMAKLANSLKLPGVDARIAEITNNKDVFRKKMQELGYPTPRYKVIKEEDISDIEYIVKDMGYPLIVKNTDSSGSRGTKIFYKEDLEGVKELIKEAINCSRSRKALIEEVWVGEEQTVETLFDINGVFHPCFITDRHFDKSNGYTIETGLRHPTVLPEKIQNEMYELIKSISMDLGINIGAAKADLILTKDGPRIIEMTVRLSGGFDCQYLVPAATSKNVLKAAILTAVGKTFDKSLLEDKKKLIGLTGSIWPEPGLITKISGVEEAKNIPGFEKIFFRYKLGDVVDSYVDCTKRVCFIIVTGETEAQARESLEKIQSIVRIETRRG